MKSKSANASLNKLLEAARINKPLKIKCRDFTQDPISGSWTENKPFECIAFNIRVLNIFGYIRITFNHMYMGECCTYSLVPKFLISARDAT